MARVGDVLLAVVELTHPEVLIVREATGRAGLALELGGQGDGAAVLGREDLREGQNPHAVVLALAVVGQPDEIACRRDAARVTRVGSAVGGDQLDIAGILGACGIGHVDAAGAHAVGHVAALKVDLLFGDVGVALGHQPVTEAGDKVFLVGVSEKVVEYQRRQQIQSQHEDEDQGHKPAQDQSNPFGDLLPNGQLFGVFHNHQPFFCVVVSKTAY